MEFLRKISQLNRNRKNRVFTLLEGEALGEKLILSDGEAVYCSGGKDFFDRNKEKLALCEDSGIINTDGRELLAETLSFGKKLVICGGGHVSIPVIKLGNMLGFHTSVIEDRVLFADNARRAGASEVICEDFEKALAKIEGDADTFFVIVTRGHRYDETCLLSISGKPHAYMGMIGSRRRVKLVKESVLERGADREAIERLHSPIGLAIGAETPEEIAVAIMAEIIQVKSGLPSGYAYAPELISAAIESEEAAAMATIIRRKGSAPRGLGTRMLIKADGSCTGTIGGGCAEADVIKRARLMLNTGHNNKEIIRVDMTAGAAEDEGMVCGGIIDVLLETLA